MLTAQPVVKTQMLIRKAVAEVFEAFIDPAVTTKFWFTKSRDRVEASSQLQWAAEMYGASAPVDVKEVDRDKRILIEWDDPPRATEWLFEARSENTTLVTIFTWGFSGDHDEVMVSALDNMKGFTLLLAGLKAYLEHGIELNLTGNQTPDFQIKN